MRRFWSLAYQRWMALNEWLRAFVVATVLLALVHGFLFRVVNVQSTSMFATLMPGDLLLVQRWPVVTGVERNDVVVFRDPLKDDRALSRRPLLVKRIAGLPGDEVELRKGVLYVNGQRAGDPAGLTWSHLLRVRSSVDADSLLRALDLPPAYAGRQRRTVEVALTDAQADQLRELPQVVSVERMGTATGAPRHIFPFSPFFPWNGDNYGPLTVPGKGDTLTITASNLPLYDRLITQYEGHRLGVGGGELTLDDKPLTTYVVEQDYYLVLGDSRHHSSDSRYWGFVPHDHLVGRASVVLLSKGPSGLRNGRWWRGL